MAKRRLYRVDAFADRLFGGNPACVVPDARGLTDGAMRAIAREMSCGATAFVLPATRAECTHRVRFFKPGGEELATCGHGTIATFAVLAVRGEAGERAVMECGAGDVPVRVELGAAGVRVAMRQGAGKFAPAAEGAAILATTGGAWVAIAPHGDVASVASFAPTADAVRALGATRVYAFALATGGSATRAHARYFFVEGDAVHEDPVTGTAAGALAAWLEDRGLVAREETITIEQGIECHRPGTVEATVEHDGHVTIRGGAVLALEAEIDA